MFSPPYGLSSFLLSPPENGLSLLSPPNGLSFWLLFDWFTLELLISLFCPSFWIELSFSFAWDKYGLSLFGSSGFTSLDFTPFLGLFLNEVYLQSKLLSSLLFWELPLNSIPEGWSNGLLFWSNEYPPCCPYGLLPCGFCWLLSKLLFPPWGEP